MSIMDRITAQLTDWDAQHETLGCPGGPGCVHTAVAALREVLKFHQRASGDPDWCDGCGWGTEDQRCITIGAIADALGIKEET